MQTKTAESEKSLMDRMDALIKSIKSRKKSLQDKDLAVAMGYRAGYISECRSKKKVSEKFVNKLADFFNSLENTNQAEANEVVPEDAFNQPIIQVVLNLSYIGRKNADTMDSMAEGVKEMAATNRENTEIIAALVAAVLPNSKLAAKLAASLAGQHEDDDRPVESFLNKGGIDLLKEQMQTGKKGVEGK